MHYDQAEVDLFVSMWQLGTPLSVDALLHLATHPPVHISSFGSDTTHSVQSKGAPPHADSNSPALASNALAGRDLSTAVQTAVATLTTQGRAVPGGGGEQYFTHTRNPQHSGPGPWVSVTLGKKGAAQTDRVQCNYCTNIL